MSTTKELIGNHIKALEQNSKTIDIRIKKISEKPELCRNDLEKLIELSQEKLVSLKTATEMYVILGSIKD